MTILYKPTRFHLAKPGIWLTCELCGNHAVRVDCKIDHDKCSRFAKMRQNKYNKFPNSDVDLNGFISTSRVSGRNSVGCTVPKRPRRHIAAGPWHQHFQGDATHLQKSASQDVHLQRILVFLLISCHQTGSWFYPVLAGLPSLEACVPPLPSADSGGHRLLCSGSVWTLATSLQQETAALLDAWVAWVPKKGSDCKPERDTSLCFGQEMVLASAVCVLTINLTCFVLGNIPCAMNALTSGRQKWDKLQQGLHFISKLWGAHVTDQRTRWCIQPAGNDLTSSMTVIIWALSIAALSKEGLLTETTWSDKKLSKFLLSKSYRWRKKNVIHYQAFPLAAMLSKTGADICFSLSLALHALVLLRWLFSRVH